MFLKYHVICSHIYCYWNISLTPLGDIPLLEKSYVKYPTTTSMLPETNLYTIEWVLSTFPNIGFIELSSNLNSLHEQLKNIKTITNVYQTHVKSPATTSMGPRIIFIPWGGLFIENLNDLHG